MASANKRDSERLGDKKGRRETERETRTRGVAANPDGEAADGDRRRRRGEQGEAS